MKRWYYMQSTVGRSLVKVSGRLEKNWTLGRHFCVFYLVARSAHLIIFSEIAAKLNETLIIYAKYIGTVIGDGFRTIGVELTSRQALLCFLLNSQIRPFNNFFSDHSQTQWNVDNICNRAWDTLWWRFQDDWRRIHLSAGNFVFFT